jgi:hypothetical protein
LSLFNKIDLNCYVILTLSNDKLLLIIYLFLICAFFPSFTSNTSSIISINFRADLDAQNAGNGIFGLQISKFFGGEYDHTHVTIGHYYPRLISNDKLWLFF